MQPKWGAEAQRWLSEARNDIRAAEAMMEAGHMNWVCFLAQQAAEKAVKGFLYGEGVEDPWGHSVADLLRDAVTYNESLSSLQATGGLLDKFYIPTRYPNGLPGGLPSEAYSGDEAQQAIDWAVEVIGAVESQRKPKSPD
jgi:HEPN domain-containing protein